MKIGKALDPEDRLRGINGGLRKIGMPPARLWAVAPGDIVEELCIHEYLAPEAAWDDTCSMSFPAWSEWFYFQGQAVEYPFSIRKRCRHNPYQVSSAIKSSHSRYFSFSPLTIEKYACWIV